MTQKEYLGGVSATNLSANMTNVDTTFSVTTGGGSTFPTGGTYPFVVVVGRGTSAEEKMLIGSRTGDAFTVTTRGYDGTSAVAHTGNPAVEHCIDALVITEASNTAAQTTSKATAADQILVSSGAGTFAALDIAASRVVGRKASGATAAMTGAETRTVLGLGTAATKDTGYGASQIPVLTATPGTPDGTKFLRDDGTWAAAAGGASTAVAVDAYASGATSLTTATVTAIALASEIFDTDTLHDNVTANTKLSLTAGKWLIIGSVGYASNATGERQAIIKQGGSTAIASGVVAAAAIGGQTASATAIISLSGSDYVELYGYQTSGGSLNTSTGRDVTFLRAFKIGS